MLELCLSFRKLISMKGVVGKCFFFDFDWSLVAPPTPSSFEADSKKNLRKKANKIAKVTKDNSYYGLSIEERYDDSTEKLTKPPGESMLRLEFRDFFGFVDVSTNSAVRRNL